MDTKEVFPSKKPRHVLSKDGTELKVPNDWDLLLPGDAALSRRIKKHGPTWTMKEKKGRKVFSRGIWAPKHSLEAIRSDLEQERTTPEYKRKLENSRERRQVKQQQYAEDFHSEVYLFLKFNERYRELADKMALHICLHAVPVGSGTVARTQRIPIEERAEAATIAWMRHQTTAYDDMHIPLIKGKRREVRRKLAKQSIRLLERYRSGANIDFSVCPLHQAILKQEKERKQN